MKSVVIGTAGHIDHGKSSLVLALTGTDPDRLKEEKARGITIDLGFAHTQAGEIDLAFVDVPGHERFVKNMLAGVGGIDAVLLVIAADESVMPQTREHFAICRLLQIPTGVIALTKTDLVDADMIGVAAMEARALVAGSPLAEAPIVPVSARSGAGLDALRDALASVALRADARAAVGAPRLPIDRVFSMRGFGTVVTGTLTQGTLRVDDELVVLPSEHRVKVRGLQVHGAAQTEAQAGRRVAVNLGGVEVADVRRGDTLTAAGAFAVTRRFDARVELLPDSHALRHGARVRFHHGTAELLARVALGAAEHAANGEGVDRSAEGGGEPLVELPPGGRAFARVRLEAPAVLARGDRFVIRQYSPPITIGGGVVLDPLPARTPIRTPAAARRFVRLASSDGEAAMAFVEESRAAGMAADALARRAGAAPSGAVVTIGSSVFSAAVVADLERRLLAEVDAYHRAQPMSEGMPREEARERVFGAGAPALFDEVVQRLARTGTLGGRDRLALPGRGVSLSDEESRAQTALERAFRDAALAPPDVVAAAAAAGVAPAVADRVCKLLIRQKALVRVDTLLFHAEALERLKREVLAMKGTAAKVDVAAFKERYGLSRKYAIPLLEWLDRERVTRRVGDARVIL
jgi:selenocysteine-specific elongation factor